METQTIKNQEKAAKVTERISGSEAIVRCLIAEDNLPTESISSAAKKIKLLLLDVDGFLTDGRL
mgnify:CR=1 FL=1